MISGDRRSARPAGRVVQGERGVVRFAQDCFPKYGTAVRAFEIARLTPDEYVEAPAANSPIEEADNEGAWNSVRMHHVDAHQLDDGSWLAVIDGHGRPSETASRL